MKFLSQILSSTSRTIECAGNAIDEFNVEVEKFSKKLSHKLKEEAPLRELKRKIELYERNVKTEYSVKEMFEEFSIKGRIDIQKILIATQLNISDKNEINRIAEQKAKQDYNELKELLLRTTQLKIDLEKTIRELSKNIYGEDISKLDIADIKKYLFDNWNVA